jgi:hypothetical protein
MAAPIIERSTETKKRPTPSKLMHQVSKIPLIRTHDGKHADGVPRRRPYNTSQV